MKEVWNSAVVEHTRSMKVAVALEEPTRFALGIVALSFSRSHRGGRPEAGTESVCSEGVYGLLRLQSLSRNGMACCRRGQSPRSTRRGASFCPGKLPGQKQH